MECNRPLNTAVTSMFLLCLHVVLDGAVSGSNEKGNELKKMKFYKHLLLGIFDK
jgi:hypothetical protein